MKIFPGDDFDSFCFDIGSLSASHSSVSLVSLLTIPLLKKISPDEEGIFEEFREVRRGWNPQ